MRIPRFFSARSDSTPAPAATADARDVLAPPPLSLDFQKLMGRDEVTGLPNRHAFGHVLAQQAALAMRLQTRLSLLVVNCDSYAPYADANGANARERHLIELANKLRGCCRRAYDVLGSLQPGQFAVLLPFTDGAGADAVARNMANALRPLELEPAEVEPAIAAGLGYVPLVGNDFVTASLADLFGVSTLSIGGAAYVGRGDLCDLRMMEVAEEACRVALAGGGDRALRRDTPLGPAGGKRPGRPD
jgi:diguanylate cyclase (GGDEF)-like protein